jgi:multiple sugar transport system permease protein
MRGERYTLIAFLLPGLIVLGITTIYTTIYLLNVSFTSWDLARPGSDVYIGLENYSRLVSDARYWHSMKIAVYFCGITVLGQVAIGLGTALLLNISLRGINVVRSLFIIPMILPPVVVALMWKMLYMPEVGLIDYYMGTLGLPFKPLLTQQSTALWGISIADIWEWTPFATLTLLAALQSVSQELYSAAKVDGATAWQCFRYITLPLVKPAIFLIVIFRLIESMKTFPKIFVMTDGGPGIATETVNYYAFLQGFHFLSVGYSSAIVITMVIVILFITYQFSRILSRQILEQL